MKIRATANFGIFGEKLFPILKDYRPLSRAKFEQDKKQTKKGMFLKKVRKL